MLPYYDSLWKLNIMPLEFSIKMSTSNTQLPGSTGNIPIIGLQSTEDITAFKAAPSLMERSGID